MASTIRSAVRMVFLDEDEDYFYDAPLKRVTGGDNIPIPYSIKNEDENIYNYIKPISYSIKNENI
jgi:hypothetical protein